MIFDVFAWSKYLEILQNATFEQSFNTSYIYATVNTVANLNDIQVKVEGGCLFSDDMH